MNKKTRPSALWLLLICLMMATLACGGGKTATVASSSAATNTTGGSDASSPTVSVTPATSVINAGLTQQFSSSVSGTTSTGVTWSVNGTSGGSSKVGTISTSGLYTAPSSVPSGGSVTVTATSAADTTKSASASVSILASGSVSVSGSSTPTPSNGKAYYVSPNGSDSNPGTASAPFLTIQHAADAATAGYTVYVAPGTYNVSSPIASSNNGTSSAPIVFISTTQWGAKIVTTASEGIYVSGSYTTFQDFDISASGTGTAELLKLTGSISDSAIGNRIHDMGASGCISGAGVQVGTGGTNHHVVGNYIYNIGLAPSAACNQTHGIYVLTNSNTIQANVIFNCEDLGIQIDGNGPSNNIVTNNTIFGNWRGIVVDSGDGGSNTATGNVISNNIVYNNLGAGIYDGADGPVSGNIISNNLIDGNSPNLSLSGDTASNTITANPDFVNYTGDDTGNYQLAATSPAYHAGTHTDAPATDAAGNAYNNPPSLGAYE